MAISVDLYVCQSKNFLGNKNFSETKWSHGLILFPPLEGGVYTLHPKHERSLKFTSDLLIINELIL